SAQMMLLMDRPSQPMHAGGMQMLHLPVNASRNFIPALVEKLRAIPPRPPFNQIVAGTLLNHWKTVPVNMKHHVRHVRLPEPGSVEQLMQWAEGLYSSPLNRSLPLWEMWVLEGIEGNRFAIAIKAHHALVDGQGGMKLFMGSFATKATDRRVRAFWGDNPKEHRKTTPVAKRAGVSRRTDTPSPSSIAGWLKNAQALWPLQGRPTRLNGSPQSVERRFGFCNLPLPMMKEVSRRHEVTINDLIVTLVDHATHRYLAESGTPEPGPLVLMMPVSTRKPGSDGGNQVTGVTATLGAQNASIVERLAAVHQSLKQGKNAVSMLPKAAQFGYMAMLGMVMPQVAKWARLVGVSLSPFNLLVSNISPPPGAHYVDRPLYLAGAVMEGLYIQPILNVSILLNVTVAGYNNVLNVGIGSAPGAIDEPMRLGKAMEEALLELARPRRTSGRTSPAVRKPTRPAASAAQRH
ncbi:MAG: wax ester/triacylglycerol synthase domain-containing protein, partial [Steroidobacteraceae bacterium]